MDVSIVLGEKLNGVTYGGVVSLVPTTSSRVGKLAAAECAGVQRRYVSDLIVCAHRLNGPDFRLAVPQGDHAASRGRLVSRRKL